MHLVQHSGYFRSGGARGMYLLYSAVATSGRVRFTIWREEPVYVYCMSLPTSGRVGGVDCTVSKMGNCCINVVQQSGSFRYGGRLYREKSG